MRRPYFPTWKQLASYFLALGLATSHIQLNLFADDVEVAVKKLPLLPPEPARDQRADWLIESTPYKAQVYRTNNSNEIVLNNGLVQRTFRVAPNGATVGLDNLVTGESLLRGVKPEAVVTIDGKRYDVGGLTGQPNYAYLKPQWLNAMKADPAAMRLTGFAVGKPEERFAWKRVRHHAKARWCRQRKPLHSRRGLDSQSVQRRVPRADNKLPALRLYRLPYQT